MAYRVRLGLVASKLQLSRFFNLFGTLSLSKKEKADKAISDGGKKDLQDCGGNVPIGRGFAVCGKILF